MDLSAPKHRSTRLLVGVGLLVVGSVVVEYLLSAPEVTDVQQAPVQPASVAAFTDDFGRRETLKEGGRMHESSSANWWVNSGGYLYVNGGVAKTIQGSLPADDERRLKHAQNNPDETDDGYHPQNIFRLVTRTQWQHLEQQAYYRITAYNLSPSVHRFEANGLLLFNRYQDGDNLYYTGLRVDGGAIIKKKIGGKYFTMAENKVLPGEYDRNGNPNLIPLNVWIGIKSVVSTNTDGTVTVSVFTDIGKTGTWTLVAAADDDGKAFGGAPILEKGHAGIRTDFMDAEFSDYRIVELP